MRINEKIYMDKAGLTANGPINIVALGDSITHGAFNDYNNYEDAYWNVLKKKLNKFRDGIPVNVINAGIGGATAFRSLDRIERDVLSHHPDLIIVCFGLNDVNEDLEQYLSSLEIIFEKCADSGAEVIFMTPNMLNTYVANDTPKKWANYAVKTMGFQNSGRMDEYISNAVQVAEKAGIKVCDCYKKWKEMHKNGVDTTMLLANRINHPNEQMHALFADMLFDMVMDNTNLTPPENINTMFEK